MGPMNLVDARKILAVGTGVGVEIGKHDLRVVMVRVRPSGVAILGVTTIAGFRERPAGEWGAEYAEFLKGLAGSHLAATALLPRREVIVRPVALPGVSGRDLGSAIQYQIDSLHPYGEDEAYYAWARLPKTASVLIGITRRSTIERYLTLFGEAGVKIASFTISASAVYSGVRLLSAPPAAGFLSVAGSEGELEMYGESPSHPVFSAVLDSPQQRAASLAASELRLPPDAELLALPLALPVPKSAPADYDLSRSALPYAAALAGACPRLALGVNLLPPEHRSASSRAMFIPSVALGFVLLLLLVGLAVQAKLQDRRYLAETEAEVARLEPQANKAAEARRSVESALARIRLLDRFRRRTPSDLEALTELTRLLKPPVWLRELELTRNSATFGGEADQAAPLLKILDASPLFQGSEFTRPISRAQKAEVFRIHASREGATE